MNNTNILNSLNRATSIIANERSRQEALQEIDNAIQELTDLRRKVAGESHTAGNSFGGQFGNFQGEPLPE